MKRWASGKAISTASFSRPTSRARTSTSRSTSRSPASIPLSGSTRIRNAGCSRPSFGAWRSTGRSPTFPGPAGALARAIVAGDSEAALKAVDEGAGVNATLSDWTPLEAAAACDRRDLAGMLVRDERLTGAFSWGTALTPLLLALVAGQPDIAAVLLEKGARVDGEAKEGALAPLPMAAVLGSPGVVSRLIERGADIDVRAVGGRTPLMFACESGSLECAQALIKAGRRPRPAGRRRRHRAHDGRRLGPQSRSCACSSSTARRSISRTTKAGPASSWPSSRATPDSSGSSSPPGADVDANVFATGQTALLQALEGDKFDIARMLIASGANVNLHKDGQVTPAHGGGRQEPRATLSGS